MLPDLKQKLTFTLQDEDYTYSFTITGTPLNKDSALEWFEYQVLPALGYSVKMNGIEE